MKQKNNKIIWIISVILVLIVAYLLSPREGRVPYSEAGWLQFLPHINGTINSIVSILLISAFIAVKKRKIEVHKKLMLSAVGLSLVFLSSYVTYHYFVRETHFGGNATMKTIYYIILISHVLLAMVSVPLVLFALFFALRNEVRKHKKVVKFAFPIWLYVAISGVLVYLMISPYYVQ